MNFGNLTSSNPNSNIQRALLGYTTQQSQLLSQLNSLEDRLSSMIQGMNSRSIQMEPSSVANTTTSQNLTPNQSYMLNFPSGTNISNSFLASDGKVTPSFPLSMPQSVSSSLPRYENKVDIDFDTLEKSQILNVLQTNNILLNQALKNFETTNNTISKTRESTEKFEKDILESKEARPIPQLSIQNSKDLKIKRNDNPSAKSLFNHLVGSPKPFQYELTLDSKIPNPISKGKNIVIKVKLTDVSTKEIVHNKNKIVLNFSLHTWEIPSKQILKNKIGNRAVTGQTEIEMVNGEATFTSLQINEVTSKFINKHVAILIVPSKAVNQGISLASLDPKEDISFELIKPLLIDKVVVKSQKKKQQIKKEEQHEDDYEDDE